MYPEEHFIEKPVKDAMEKFRKQLVEITSAIKARNEGKNLPYYNMSPDKIPNSVAVWRVEETRPPPPSWWFPDDEMTELSHQIKQRQDFDLIMGFFPHILVAMTY